MLRAMTLFTADNLNRGIFPKCHSLTIVRELHKIKSIRILPSPSLRCFGLDTCCLSPRKSGTHPRTYPDGKQIVFAPYGNGLPIQITDGDATFQSAHYYAPNGAASEMYVGPPSNADAVYQAFYYNKRLQPAVMYAVDSSNSYIASYCYDYHVGGGATIGDI
jgi:hypothetical protein